MEPNKALEYITNLYNTGKEAINDTTLKAYISTEQKLKNSLPGAIAAQPVQQQDTGEPSPTLVDSTNISDSLVSKYRDEGLTILAFLTGAGLLASGLTDLKKKETSGLGKAIAGTSVMIGSVFVYVVTKG